MPFDNPKDTYNYRMPYATNTINVLKMGQGQMIEQLSIQQSSRTSLWKIMMQFFGW